jgi:lipopolysaccharide biosynthesis glycosyltransferase
MKKNLIYLCASYSKGFIECLDVFCKSLVYNTKNDIDFLLLCDKSFIEKCDSILKKYPKINYKIHGFEDAANRDDAFPRKLRVFECDYIKEFENLLYVDMDCIFNGDVYSLIDKDIQDDMLYVYYEHDINSHNIIYWTLPGYYSVIDKYNIMKSGKKPFNSGLFYIKSSEIMKKHFNNVLDLIKNWKKEHYWDQSFMNVYFNKLLKTDGSLFTKENYKLFAANDIKQNETILHFCGHPGDGHTKVGNMNKYWEKFG